MKAPTKGCDASHLHNCDGSWRWQGYDDLADEASYCILHIIKHGGGMSKLLIDAGCLQVVIGVLKSRSKRISRVVQANAISLLYDLLSESDAYERRSMAVESGILPVLVKVRGRSSLYYGSVAPTYKV